MKLFGRADLAKNISKGEFALSVDENGTSELLFGLNSEKTGGASLVVFRKIEEEGSEFVVARHGVHSGLSVARTAWILPETSRLRLDLTLVRTPAHLHELRQATLILNRDGNLFCRTQGDLWLSFTDADLFEGLPGSEPSMVEFRKWHVVSGPPEDITTHYSIVTNGTGQLPLKYRYDR